MTNFAGFVLGKDPFGVFWFFGEFMDGVARKCNKYYISIYTIKINYVMIRFFRFRSCFRNFFGPRTFRSESAGDWG